MSGEDTYDRLQQARITYIDHDAYVSLYGKSIATDEDFSCETEVRGIVIKENCTICTSV